MRTPRMVSANGLDRITMEAQNLARLQAGQTPLAGGENPMLHTSDFSGVTPRQNVAATPNPLLGMTPRPGETPAPGATGRIIAGSISRALILSEEALTIITNDVFNRFWQAAFAGSQGLL